MPAPPTESALDVAIVGGGFSGLALAHHVRQRAPAARVMVFEASDRLGGKVSTDIIETEHGRFIVEAGPDSFLAAKPWAMDLARELGLEQRIIPINRVSRPVNVLSRGESVRLPAGLSLAAPALLRPFVASRLLTPSGRARALREPRVPVRWDDDDESVGAFIRRRFGPEMLDWVAEPLMAGIYNADPDRMSLLATFPHLRLQERRQGGLIRAARAAWRQRSPTRPPVFLSFTDGMQTLSDALINRLGAGVVVSAEVRGTSIAPDGSHRLALADGRCIQAKQVVLATPASVSAAITRASFPRLAALLDELRTNPAGSMSLAYRDGQVSQPLSGYGLLLPLRERRPINAVTVASKKFPGRAPSGWTLIRVFFGGARSPETMALDDVELARLVDAQLGELLGVSGPPLFRRITRWPGGSPQYDVGHLDRIAAIDHALPNGLHVVGSAFRGVGLPDLAREADELARALTETLV